MTARDYNAGRLASGAFTPDHVTELVRRFQRDNDLTADGMAGPKTLAMIELLTGREPGGIPLALVTPVMALGLDVDGEGWLVGEGVTHIPMHPSWRYSALKTPKSEPLAIVAHYSATDHGSAMNMAVRRTHPRDTQPTEVDGDPEDRAASWHISIEGDGSIIQMASCKVGCWHAGGPTSQPIPHVGAANRTAVGIELIGDGSVFPAAQVESAKRVWCAIVKAYHLTRGTAMVGHSQLDPSRKRDPGPVWWKLHASDVLAAAGL